MKSQYNLLIWLGAGAAEVPSNVIAQAKQAILVDAREAACLALKQQFAGDNKVRVVQQCISSDGGSVQWHQYNLAEFSATNEATGLTALFPGLKLQQRTERDSVALMSFLAELAPTAGKDAGKTALLLDCPAQNADLLKTLLAQQHIQFDSLYIATSEQPLYHGMQTKQELIAVLQQHGYQLEATDATDPDLPVIHFSRNRLWQQLQAAEQQLTVVTKQAEQAQTELTKQAEASQQAQAELNKQLEQAKQQQTELVAELKSVKQQAASEQRQLTESSNKLLAKTEQAEKNNTKILQQAEEQKLQFEQKLAESSKQLTNSVSENETLQQQLSAVKVAAEKTQAELSGQITGMDAELKQARQQLQAAEQRILTSNEEYKKQLQQLTETNAALQAQAEVYQQWQASQAKQSAEAEQKLNTALVKHLGNSVKQLEAFSSLRNLLSEGQMPLNYHGWPISADIALYLARKVVTESFDYIIEFGSGTSTIVFAQALATRQQKTAQEMACKIVSFEHNKTYLQKTSDDIQAHQVEQWVELVYAPLTEQVFDDTNYLYYSCEAKLAEISAELQNRDAKILILVDGPPAVTGPMARYPAIPLILKYLSKHQLHIVMDDYVREDEKKAAGLWSKLFEERGIKHQKEMLNFEKVGFAWILNN